MTTRVGRRLRGHDLLRFEEHQPAIALDDAAHLQPAACVDARIDVQIESFAFRSKPGDPDAPFGVSEDEVVPVFRRRCRHIAEQVPAAELTGHRDRLPFVFPRLERESPGSSASSLARPS